MRSVLPPSAAAAAAAAARAGSRAGVPAGFLVGVLAGFLAGFLVGVPAGVAPASADYEAAREAFGRQDFRVGIATLRAAAHDGDARAQNHLGTLFEDGRIVARDFGRAVFWYRKSAEQGDAQGQLNLGRMYRGGMGLERDERKAAHWYRAAAGQGVAAAQFFLGLMYEAGRGVERDPVQSWMWFSLAVEQGDEDARFRRSRLTATFGEEDFARAEAALRAHREASLARGSTDGAGADSTDDASAPPAVRGDPLVFRVQGALIALGYEPGERDGRVGSRTRDALRQFETEHGYRRSDRFDERTLERLREALETGKPAAAVVREIQTHLRRLGHPAGQVDGRPGPRTAAAVEAFQRARGLPVDGRTTVELLRLLRGAER